MKKLLVAVSAVSTITLLSGTVSADMGSWVAKKPAQSQSSTQPAPAQQIEQVQPAQAVSDSTVPQTQILPSPQQPVPGQTRPQSQAVTQGPTQPLPPKQQQQQNNQVAQEAVSQERVARALQNVMPNAVSVLNTPSLNNDQKNYGFSYIAAVSQMISDPKNMNVSSIQQAYNTAVTCAARVGAGNVISQMQGILLRDQALLENFKIAQSRGSFVNIGQQAPGVTCS